MVSSVSSQIQINSPASNGSTADSATKIVTECELYNFGHAPFQVIQKFQDFCTQFSSLSEALVEILSREPLLKRKYIFITAPVMYQMLARPTRDESRPMLEASIEALKKFTRRGRYDSVCHAIEELLFSPQRDLSLSCDKATCTYGNIDCNYTELTQVEQDVLEKIADTLVYKLAASLPEPRKRRSGSKSKRDSSPKKRAVNKSLVRASPFQIHLSDPDHKPALKHSSKFSASHLCLNPVQPDAGAGLLKEPVDMELAIPIKNFVNIKSVERPEKKFLCNTKDTMSKQDFLEEHFNLLPILK